MKQLKETDLEASTKCQMDRDKKNIGKEKRKITRKRGEDEMNGKRKKRKKGEKEENRKERRWRGGEREGKEEMRKCE